jgi:hypothetical protein
MLQFKPHRVKVAPDRDDVQRAAQGATGADENPSQCVLNRGTPS